MAEEARTVVWRAQLLPSLLQRQKDDDRILCHQPEDWISPQTSTRHVRQGSKSWQPWRYARSMPMPDDWIFQYLTLQRRNHLPKQGFWTDKSGFLPCHSDWFIDKSGTGLLISAWQWQHVPVSGGTQQCKKQIAGRRHHRTDKRLYQFVSAHRFTIRPLLYPPSTSCGSMGIFAESRAASQYIFISSLSVDTFGSICRILPTDKRIRQSFGLFRRRHWTCNPYFTG